MNPTIKKITGGIYLVINPADPEDRLFHKLETLMQADIAAVQVWDNFASHPAPLLFIEKVCSICHRGQIPVLINNDWLLLNQSSADGVHFDLPPANLDTIRKSLNRKAIFGITVNNDISLVQWAIDQQVDYISFCSVFPSVTSNSCELVKPETIAQAKAMTTMPVFLAGGIRPENMQSLQPLHFDGVAVVSGIMGSDDPLAAAEKYSNELKKFTNET